jgi:hypothetical protein
MKRNLKVLIAISRDTSDIPGPFQVKYGGEFAERKLLPHITDYKDEKHSCSNVCREYRKSYILDYSADIAGVLRFPSVLPEMIDDADMYISDELPSHDLLLIIGVHPDIMLELINKTAESGCKAIIAPREDPFWMTTSFVKKIEQKCEQMGLEYAFPRPFCSLTKGKFSIINQFIDQYRIGKPCYEIFLDENDKVNKVNVVRSSPCGATYHVASGLIGINRDEVAETANKLWHSYPCLSSSRIDPEAKDSPMHLAAYINLNVAKQAEKDAGREVSKS